MFKESPLSLASREMIGFVVSVVNKCEYCIGHHSLVLGKHWEDETAVERVRNFQFDQCNPQDKLLCQFAKTLAENPSGMNQQMADNLTSVGLSDRAILDATLVVGYFSYANRIVLGLGLELESDKVVWA